MRPQLDHPESTLAVETPPRLRVLTVGSHDSFYLSSVLLGKALSAQGCDVAHAYLAAGPCTPPDVQGTVLQRHHLATFPFVQFDYVILCTNDNWFRAVSEAILSLDGHSRPKIVAMWPGLLAYNLSTNFSARLSADIVLLSDVPALEAYEAFAAEHGGDLPRAFLLGWAQSLAPAPERREETPRAIGFLDQTVIPQYLEERRYIAQRLLELCERYPEREIILKCRSSETGCTTNPALYDMATLLRDAAGKTLPKNMVVTGEPLCDVFGRSAMMLTVSSTGAIEAIAAGVPCAIIKDFGLNEAVGTSFFIGSGCVRSFSEIDPEHPPVANDAWVRRNVVDAKPRIADLVRLLRTFGTPGPVSHFRRYGSSKEFNDFLKQRWSESEIRDGAYRRRRQLQILKIVRYKAPWLFKVVGYLLSRPWA